MRQDEIIEMAKQSELGFLLGDDWMLHHELEYFAKLVAEHERETCAKVCEEYVGYGTRTEFAATIRARGDK